MERHPRRTGVRSRVHMLSPIPVLDSSRNLVGALGAPTQPLGPKWPSGPLPCNHRQRLRSGALGGIHTGPNPTDRAKSGCKRHIITDSRGLPLTLEVTPANIPDGKRAIPLLDSIPPIQGPRGRPRFRPRIFQGDHAYGWACNIRSTRARGIQSLLARPQDKEHGSGLGSTRWVVESALSWFNRFRRIRHCYERTNESFLAFHRLAAALICYKKLRAFRRAS